MSHSFFKDLDQPQADQPPNFFGDMEQLPPQSIDFFSDISEQPQQQEKPLLNRLMDTFGQGLAYQAQTERAVTPQGASMIAKQLPAGAVEGATFGIADVAKPENEEEAFVREIGRAYGLQGPISLANKALSPLIALARSSPIAPKALSAFTRLTGAGLTGAGIKTAETAFKTGELPTKEELLKEGTTWAAIDAIMQGLGLGVQFGQAVNNIAKKEGVPAKDVLGKLWQSTKNYFKTPKLQPSDIGKQQAEALTKEAQKAEKSGLESIENQPKAPIDGANIDFKGKQGKTLEEAVSFDVGESKKPKSEPGKFRTSVVDELYPIQRYVEDAKVADLPISEDPYKMARLFKGWSGKAETFLNYKPFDPETIRFHGKGFKEIIKPYKDQLQDLSKYLIAKRAIELRGRGKETGIDIGDAERYLKENGKYEKAFNQLKDYQNSLLEYAEKSGLISPETKKAWQAINENYVPFNRVMEEDQAKYFGKSLEPSKVFYELVGSQRRVIDPLESIIGNTYTIIRASEQNRTLKAFVDFDKKHRGANEFIDLSETHSEPESLKNFFDYLKGEDVVKSDEFRYFDNGKIKTYKVSKDVAAALKGLKEEQIPFWGQLFSYPTRLVRTGAVTLSPGTLLKLATLDQLEAFLYSDIGYVPYVDLARGFFNAIKKPALYHQWKAAGGDQALAREMSRNFKRIKLGRVTGKKIADNEFGSFDSALRAFEAITRPLEEATRISVFEKALKRTGMSPNDLREAALTARETTLDFARRGSRTKFLTQAIPFFNSSIQGAAKFYDEMKHNPKLVPKALAALTLPTLLLYYLNKDRKEYQELPEWEKDKYWHFYIPYGDKIVHLKMAKPFELGAVFGTTPERLAAWANEKDPDNLKQIPKNLWEIFTPGFVPALLQPAIETYANKKTFSGRPIVPIGLERLPPEEQFSPYTSVSAKNAGKLLSRVPFIGETKAASPLVLDEWLNSYTAGMGNKLVNMIESTLRKTGTLPKKVEPEKELADYPILKEFFGRKGYTKQADSINKFYEQSKKLDGRSAAIRKAKKERRYEDAERLAREFDQGKYAQSQRIRQAFAKQNSMIQNILVDTESYTGSEKKILIDQIVEDMVGVSRSFLDKD